VFSQSYQDVVSHLSGGEEMHNLTQRIKEVEAALQERSAWLNPPSSIEAWYHDEPIVLTRHKTPWGVEYSIQIHVSDTTYAVTCAVWFDDEKTLTRYHHQGWPDAKGVTIDTLTTLRVLVASLADAASKVTEADVRSKNIKSSLSSK